MPAGAPRSLLQRWLADIDPQRQGLPPEAIVVVRRLSARLAALQGTGADPFAVALRQAVRPAREHVVGAGVGAVWFADEAELLACLARDALGGALGQAWWWPLLFGRAPTAPLVLARWVAHARDMPRALALLQADDLGEPWLHSLGVAGVAELLHGLARDWPLGEAVRRYVQAGPAQEAMMSSASGDLQAGDVASAAHGHDTAAQRVRAPHRLLQLAALLRQAPHRATDAAVVDEWVAAGPDLGMPGAITTAGVVPSSEWATGVNRPVVTSAVMWKAAPAAHGAAAPSAPAAAPPQVAPWGQPTAAGWDVRPARGLALLRAPAQTQHRPAAQVLGPDRAAGLPPAARTRGPDLAADAGAAISFCTPHGGLAFLVNVALALGLYGDFTQPQHRGQPLSPWWLLHEAGRAAWGRAWRADPLTAWLRGRAAALPGRVEPAWQLPASALAPFAADARPWHAVRSPQALVLRHPAGFVVARQEQATEVSGLLQSLQRPSQPVRLHAARLARRGPPLAALLWPLLRARLAQGLGLPARAALGTLGLPARVQARGERLDLHFSLAALPLCVRLAGLDRDPGWVPAAGCDIRFHFD